MALSMPSNYGGSGPAVTGTPGNYSTSGGGSSGNQGGQPQGNLATDASGNVIQHGAAPTGTLPNGQMSTDTANTPTPITNGQQAFEAAKASGPAPQDAGTAATAMQQFNPTPPVFYKPGTAQNGYNAQTVFDSSGKALTYDQYLAAGGAKDFSNVKAGTPPTATPDASALHTPDTITKALAEDPGYQQILTAAKDAQTSATQKTTLVQQYTDLMDKYNIPTINAELINDKKIIDGTEDDIRHEVTAAGGFASESQIQALSISRNKTLLLNYNALQATKTDAMTTINTMIGLAGQDRTFAQNAANQQLDTALKEADYQQKFLQNAQEGYKNVIAAVGYSGLYASLSHDPNSVSLAEQVLQLPPGTLANVASEPDPEKQLKAVQLAQAQLNLTQSTTEEPLKIAELKASINDKNLSAAKTKAETDFMSSHGGMTQAEYDTQQKSIEDHTATINKDVGTQVENLANHKTTWGAAFNAISSTYPDLQTSDVDKLLHAELYRNPAFGG